MWSLSKIKYSKKILVRLPSSIYPIQQVKECMYLHFTGDNGESGGKIIESG